MRFISLSSGSSGNSYFLGDDTLSLLIDAGIGIRTIKKGLSNYDISTEEIEFILITHDHSDHIKHVKSLSRRLQKPVISTGAILKAIDSAPPHKNEKSWFWREIEKEVGYTIKGVDIIAFEVPHDGVDNLGFFIDFRGEKFTFITDLGEVTEKVLYYASRSNHLILESNYDCKMLEESSYPSVLKERIRGRKGHLSNSEAAAAIKKIYHPGVKNIFLCHLSENCNTPTLAFTAAAEALKEVEGGEKINLFPLPRRGHQSFNI
ncbi:MAG: MBL fold metallo-hydrolase [Bacteroidales bacterium]